MSSSSQYLPEEIDRLWLYGASPAGSDQALAAVAAVESSGRDGRAPRRQVRETSWAQVQVSVRLDTAALTRSMLWNH